MATYYPPCPQGSQAPVFDTTRCNDGQLGNITSSSQIPCIFPIPAADWLRNSVVPDPPEDIADCPTIPIPLPDPEPLCPEITFLQNPQGGFAEVSVVPIGQERAVFSILKGECCDYDFDLQIDFPCPQLISNVNQGTVAGTIVVAPCGVAPSAALLITKSGDCTYDFGLNIRLPCPQDYFGLAIPQLPCPELDATIKVKRSVPVYDPIYPFLPPAIPQSRIVITGSNCLPQFNFDLVLPCPQLTGTVKVKKKLESNPQDPQNDNTVTVTGPDCAPQFNFDLVLPCPQLTGSVKVRRKTDTPQGPQDAQGANDNGGLTITGPDCAPQFNFDLVLPCPQLTGSVKVRQKTDQPSDGAQGAQGGQAEEKPSGSTLTVTGPECSPQFDFDLVIPCPQQTATVKVRPKLVVAEPFVRTQLPYFPEDSLGGAEALRMPPGVEALTNDPGAQGAQVSISGSNESTVTITGTDCAPQFNFDLVLPCPQITATVVVRQLIERKQMPYFPTDSLFPAEALTMPPGIEALTADPGAQGGQAEATGSTVTILGPDCAPQFNFDLVLPCPQISATATITVESGSQGPQDGVQGGQSAAKTGVTVTGPYCAPQFDFHLVIPKGAVGPLGGQGPRGGAGPIGSQGPKGPGGLPGLPGTPGYDGLPGMPGPTGLTGPTGGQGPRGGTGPTGAQGPRGAAGAKGAQGAKGAAGPPGSPGTSCLCPEVVTPAAMTLDDQFNPYLLENLENGPAAMSFIDPELLADLFNTQATAGPQGARGAQGGVGRQGPRGPSAADIVVGLPIPSLEDGTARLGSLYYSTEQHSLVYKHSDGVLFRLAMTAISSP